MRRIVSALSLFFLAISPALAAEDAAPNPPPDAGAADSSAADSTAPAASAPAAAPESTPAPESLPAPESTGAPENAAPPAAAAMPAEAQPPFGLKWGMHVNDLSSLGIKVASTSTSGNIVVVNVKELPNAFPDTDAVNMLFDRQLGLVKVRWTSTAVAGDPNGSQGRSKYVEMKKTVVETRGNPSDETLVVGARLFDQEDEFYQCLTYEGCGVWSALWEEKPSGGVLLSVEGLGPGQGYVQLDFESADWQKVAGAAK